MPFVCFNPPRKRHSQFSWHWVKFRVASTSNPARASVHEDAKLKAKALRMSREGANVLQRPWVQAGHGLEHLTSEAKQTSPLATYIWGILFQWQKAKLL